MTGAQGDQQVAIPVAAVALQIGTRHLWGFEYATLDTGKLRSGAIGYLLWRELSLTVDYRAGLVKLRPPGRE